MALTDKLTAIGDAIREKNGTTEPIPLANMPQAILDIEGGDGKEEQEKTITITENGTSEIVPDSNKTLSKVTVVTDVVGGGESGGATLNIAYGETAPEDTSKLWIKANEPDNLIFKRDVDGAESVKLLDAHLPKAGSSRGCAKVDNKIYLFGGYNGSATYTYNTINVFDTETETITTLSATLPTSCYGMGCVAVGTKIYLFGGAGYSYGSAVHYNTINVFDTETETITTLSTKLPTERYSISCVAVGTKIYLFGGSSYSNTINVFDTETETITTLSTKLPTGCSSLGCVAVGTKIYLFGGSGSSSYLNTINVFDPETETIATLSATLPNAYGSMGCAAIGTKIYLFGGYGTDTNKLNTISVFDPETETIATLSATLPTACSSLGCANVGNRIYLFGGSNLNTINKFTLTSPLSQGNIELQTSFLNNVFKLINTENAQIEIGVENVYIGNENNEAELCEAYLYNGTEWIQI